jgi:hypothetical protein
MLLLGRATKSLERVLGCITLLGLALSCMVLRCRTRLRDIFDGCLFDGFDLRHQSFALQLHNMLYVLGPSVRVSCTGSRGL